MTDVTGAVDCSDRPDSPVAIVLAAGSGSRFSGVTHKLAATIGDRTVLEAALDAAVAAAIGEVVVVVSVGIRGQLSQQPPFTSATTLVNPTPERGMQSSLRIALDHARERGVRRVVVALGDQPFLTADGWRAVAEAGLESPIAVATYAGRRGHPVSLADTLWPLLPADGDEGARALMALRPDLVHEVPCSGSPADIDTLEDLHRWQSS